MARQPRLGGRIRRLRRDRGLAQRELARRLGISPSYLNLIEHNQRPLPAPLLLDLARVLDADLDSFSDDDEARYVAGLTEAFSDVLFADEAPGEADLQELAAVSPATCRAVLTLYRAYRAARDDIETLGERLADHDYYAADHEFRTLLTSILSFSEILHDNADIGPEQRQHFLDIIVGESERLRGMIDRVLHRAADGALTEIGRPRQPAEEVSDLFQARRNYFPALEAAAEGLRRSARLDSTDPLGRLSDYLAERHRVDIVLVSEPESDGALRRYDAEGRRLYISEMLNFSSRTFQIALQAGLVEYGALFDEIVTEARLSGPTAATLCRLALANYFAAAALMPYDRFLEAARSHRYDINRLAHRFGTSFEQVCHRLATLQRPDAAGVPFHLVRVDIAGNVSLRFSASGIRIARFGGICPRWAVHSAFLTPGKIHGQLGRMPDGTAYFCIARTVGKSGMGYGSPESHYSIGLGCEVSHAHELAYADGLDLDRLEAAVPIGVSCRLCERTDCRQRAHPPLNRRLVLDENVRGPSIHVSSPAAPSQ